MISNQGRDLKVIWGGLQGSDPCILMGDGLVAALIDAAADEDGRVAGTGGQGPRAWIIANQVRLQRWEGVPDCQRRSHCSMQR